MGGNNEFFENLKETNILKKLPSMQRVNNTCTSKDDKMPHNAFLRPLHTSKPFTNNEQQY